MGATAMTNNQVIPITDGLPKPKRRRIAAQATTGARGIELHLELRPDSADISPQANSRLAEGSAIAEAICFKGCSETEDGDRSYWIASDNRVGVLAAGQAKPADDAVVSVSSLEELTTATSHWPMPQLVSVWNQIPGARRVTRFENRSIAIERLWRALEALPEADSDTAGKPESGKEKKRVGPSKSERLIELLRTPGGVTLQALMAASGWQAHSVRGFLSGKLSKQLGLRVESFRREGERVYALPSAAQEQPQ